MKLVSSKYAGIDIGSNAVRLLIMHVHEYRGKTYFKKISLTRVPIRLGEDVFLKGEISERNKNRMLHAMKSFYHLMQLHEVNDHLACATSAMRDSSNGKEIVAEIAKETGIKIEIIDGKREAELIYATQIESILDNSKNYLYIDVGGWSTELTLFANSEKQTSQSFNIGTIRILHDLVEHDEWERMKNWLKINAREYTNLLAIGSGGNINRLYKMAGKTNWKHLKALEIKKLEELLASYNYEERVTQLNLNTDRADVIIPASNIFLNVLRWSRANEVVVPKMGLSDGLVRLMHQKIKESKTLS